jgi:hypothetical protein
MPMLMPMLACAFFRHLSAVYMCRLSAVYMSSAW